MSGWKPGKNELHIYFLVVIFTVMFLLLLGAYSTGLCMLAMIFCIAAMMDAKEEKEVASWMFAKNSFAIAAVISLVEFTIRLFLS